MALPGAVKTKANKRSADRVFQKRQSAAQKAGTKASIKYGPYVIGGVGGLGIKVLLRKQLRNLLLLPLKNLLLLLKNLLLLLLKKHLKK